MTVTPQTPSRIDWLLFIALSFFWGSSYLFIKIGVVAGLEPFTLVMLRLLIGAAFLGSVVYFARERLPRERSFYGHISIVGLFGIALPFSLITFAEEHVDSALASVLTAPVPLFVIPIAALLLHDERLSLAKVLGVIVGLAGVAFLVGLDPAQIGRSDVVAQLLLVGAAISYALGGVWARRFMVGYRPMLPALFEVFTALLMVGVLAFLFERPLESPVTTETVVSIIWLGLVGSGLAFITFFRLLGVLGAGRTSMVAYLLPVWGIVLGWLILREQIPPSLIAGTALIIVGIAIVNLRRQAVLMRAVRLRSRLGRPRRPRPDASTGPR